MEMLSRLSPRLTLRIILVFCLLVLCKIALFVNLGQHLYETHYRLDSPGVMWLDYVCAALLGCLLLGSLLWLGRKAAGNRSPSFRGLAAWLGAFAFLFAFLSPYRMNHDYLHCLLSGVLGLRDIANYLVADFCFEKPFLILYGLGLLLGGWILWRLRRGPYIFALMGLLALIYIVSNPQFFATNGREIALIDCVGLLCFWSAIRRSEPLPWGWQLLPFALGVIGLLAFDHAEGHSLFASPSQRVLAGFVVVFFVGSNLLFRRQYAYPLLTRFLPFYVLAFFLLSNHHNEYAGNFNYYISYGLALPHYFWQEATVVLALAALAWVVSRWSANIGLACFDLGAMGLLLFAVLDIQINQRMGFRLDWHALTANTDPVLLWRTIRPFIPSFLLLLLVMFAAYYGLILFGLKKASNLLQHPSLAHYFTFSLAALLLASLFAVRFLHEDKAEGYGLVRVIQSSPWVLALAHGKEAVPCEQVEATARSLGLPILSASESLGRPGLPRGDMNVLLILQESMYNRYLSLFGAQDETQPRLKAYQDRMELFPNFYSNFAESLNARFAILSGMYPCKASVTHLNPRIESPSLFEILHSHDYHVSLFYSSHRHYQRWNDYLVCRKIDTFFDADDMPGREPSKYVSWGVEESVTMNAIKQQISAHTTHHKKFFLTYVPAAPHMPYDTPSKEFEKFENGAPFIDNNYTGRFKNQLLYMDWIVTSILEHLEHIGQLDKTLVVITTDHGEMVGEDDHTVGHGWFLEPRLCNVPLIIMNPLRHGRHLNYTLGSQVDILPTVLDLLGLPIPAGHLYEGTSLYCCDTASQNKTVYISSYRQRAKVQGDTYFLETPGPSESDRGGTVSTFKISFNDTKTSFQLQKEEPLQLSTIAPFERFQHSLVANYSRYRDYFAERLAARSSRSAVVSVQQ